MDLAIEWSGVMSRPKEMKQIGVGAYYGVELDPNHLNMVGGSGAYQLVVWIRGVTLRVSNLSLHHTNDSLKGQLHTPEATRSELSQLVVRVIRNIRIRVKGRVVAFVAYTRSHCSTCVCVCERERERERVCETKSVDFKS